MKKLFTLSIIALGLTVFSCDGVHQVTVSNEQFYTNKDAENSIDKYNVYFHSGSSVFELKEPSLANDSLQGVPVFADPSKINEHPVTPEEMLKARKDVHVYLSEEDEQKYREKIANGEKISFSKKEVKEVKMLAKDESAIFASVGLIILLVIVGILLVYLLALLIANAADESSDGSDSGSNSDSGDSGDSDSGDSGGSNSDSGCYIATMVYGSYEAPKVMVLRSFRDNFLAKYTWGNNFIKWYYRKSPVFVSKHKENRVLGSMIRGILNVVVWCLKPFFQR